MAYPHEDRPRDPRDVDGHRRGAALRRTGHQIYAIVFALGAGLAGVAGTLISLSYALNPTMGDPFLIKAFVVCVLGGLGSVQGALVGGFAYGIIEAFATQLDVTIGTQHISGSGLQDAIALVVLLIVLIVRPTGIMGQADRVTLPTAAALSGSVWAGSPATRSRSPSRWS